MEDNRRGAEGVYAKFLEQILGSLPTPIYVKDAEARFVFSHRTHDELIGRREDELIGKSDADFYSAEATQAFLATNMNVIKIGEISVVGEMNSLKDGCVRPVSSHKARMVMDDGSIYLVGTNFDLTEIRKREEQYGALAETVPVGDIQFEEDGSVTFANPLLTATIAHELRNPMGANRTAALVMERKLRDKGMEVEQHLQRVNNGIVRCDAIITQLLDFSRTKKIIAQPCDLDAGLENAAEAKVSKGDICLVPGMDADVLAKVREPLFTTKSFGAGLGVPAIEQITVQHCGVLEITLQVGQGASFSLRLPLTVQSIGAAA